MYKGIDKGKKLNCQLKELLQFSQNTMYNTLFPRYTIDKSLFLNKLKLKVI